MNMLENVLNLTITAIIMLIFCGGMFYGYKMSYQDAYIKAQTDFQKQAVLNGYGEYTIDETGSPKWQWKEIK